MSLMTPRLKSYIQVHISPMMTLGRAQGMMMSERASPRHQKLWLSSKAAPSPSRNCRPTTPTIQISELPQRDPEHLVLHDGDEIAKADEGRARRVVQQVILQAEPSGLRHR